MLDINFIRENKELIKEGARKKRVDFDIDRLISLDDKRRETLKIVEERRAEQNKVSEEIARSGNPTGQAKAISEMKELKSGLQAEEEKLRKIMEEWQKLMLDVPNMPDMSVPEGDSEDDNVTIKEWGEKPNFSFEPKDHVELMKDLDMVDFERGTKVHGFR